MDHITLNDYEFIFMGDASVTNEKEIMNKYNLTDHDGSIMFKIKNNKLEIETSGP